MTDPDLTPEDIEAVAGTEDENGVIQPSLEEIIDPDAESEDDIEGIGDENGDDEPPLTAPLEGVGGA